MESEIAPDFSMSLTADVVPPEAVVVDVPHDPK